MYSSRVKQKIVHHISLDNEYMKQMLYTAKNKSAQQGDAPEPDSCRLCLMDTTSRPGDL